MDRRHRLRIEVLALGLLGVFGLLLARCYYIQQVRHEHYRAIADRQHIREVRQAPRRGAILDRNGALLAISRQVPSIWANPGRIADPEAVATRLAAILPVSREKLLSRLSMRRRHFVWIARQVTPDLASSVRALAIPGIGFRMEAQRSYPHKELAAHVLGFCGTDQQGLEGVERAYHATLSGAKGSRLHLRDGRLRFETIHLPGALGSAAKDGSDLVLTIDLAIQRIAEEALEEAFQQFRPKRAMAIVMQVGTGDVLALSLRPTFDPNEFNRSPRTSWRNSALVDLYEPGSTIKPLIAAFALAERIYGVDSKIDCHNGRWRYRARTLRDHKPLGRLTLAEVVIHSSNIGMAQIGLALGPARLARYLTAAGFGQVPRGMRFPGAPAGRLHAPGPWSYFSTTSVTMGYELMVSPIQLVAGVNMLASGGVKTPPRLVRMAIPQGGSPRPVGRSLVTEQVLPRSVANQMCRILGRVVAEGTGKKAKLKRYKVGGKTGTAKMLEPDGSWSDSRYRSSFVGFAPVERPVVTVLVMMEEAQADGLPYGGKVAAPAVGKILERTLDYLGVVS